MTIKEGIYVVGSLAAAIAIFYAGEINQLRMDIGFIQNNVKTIMTRENKADYTGIGYSIEELMTENPLATGLLQKIHFAPDYRTIRTTLIEK